jgi:hypothetical protein
LSGPAHRRGRPKAGELRLRLTARSLKRVQIGPGATTLTLMPLGTTCWARDLLKVLMAPLVVA